MLISLLNVMVLALGLAVSKDSRIRAELFGHSPKPLATAWFEPEAPQPSPKLKVNLRFRVYTKLRRMSPKPRSETWTLLRRANSKFWCACRAQGFRTLGFSACEVIGGWGFTVWRGIEVGKESAWRAACKSLAPWVGVLPKVAGIVFSYQLTRCFLLGNY